MNNLQLIKTDKFDIAPCDFYKGANDFFMTREQIGRALEYADPKKAIEKIHLAHAERFKGTPQTGTPLLSLQLKLETPGGIQDTTVYTRKGVMEICRWSRQPKADRFMDWVFEIIDSLIRGDAILIGQRQAAEWRQARIQSKEVRLEETDAIKALIEYARQQGSKNAGKLYMVYSKLVKKLAGYEERDVADLDTLTMIMSFERILRGVILTEMKLNTHYKEIYKIAKEQLSSMKRLWAVPKLAA